MRIAVVTHGPASSKFWAIIRNGVDSAARRLDVLVDYQSPDVYSLRADERADRPGGRDQARRARRLDPRAGLAPAIRRAVEAGIPVVSINSGSDVFKSLGVLAHVGQVEDRAGLEAGRRLAAAGVRRALCINQQVGNTGARRALRAGSRGRCARPAARSRVLARRRRRAAHAEPIAEAVAADGADGVLTTNSLGGLAAAKGLAGDRREDRRRSTSARTC